MNSCKCKLCTGKAKIMFEKKSKKRIKKKLNIDFGFKKIKG